VLDGSKQEKGQAARVLDSSQAGKRPSPIFRLNFRNLFAIIGLDRKTKRNGIPLRFAI